ncbi:hypothetical protein D3C74_222440 [compost metagenome]
MIFTNGRLQSFEQMMKQPPHHHHRSPKKRSQSKATDSQNSLDVKTKNSEELREKATSPTDLQEWNSHEKQTGIL